jgi:hypothetical protein
MWWGNVVWIRLVEVREYRRDIVNRYWTFGFFKMSGNYWVAGWLVVYREGLSWLTSPLVNMSRCWYVSLVLLCTVLIVLNFPENKYCTSVDAQHLAVSHVMLPLLLTDMSAQLESSLPFTWSTNNRCLRGRKPWLEHASSHTYLWFSGVIHFRGLHRIES